MSDLTAPLMDILEEVEKLPDSGFVREIEEHNKKRYADASDEVVVLADVSASMSAAFGSLDKSKYDHLCSALADVMRAFPKVKVIAFGCTDGREVQVIGDMTKFPGPFGGTPLGAALEFARQFKPRRTVIISDGAPTDGVERCEEAAEELTGRIDTIYCGPETDAEEIAFLKGLARTGGGVHTTWDGYTQISSTVRGLLAAPAEP